ncbi:hypothetical protein Dimus_012590 [Dionaea muscipula]
MDHTRPRKEAAHYQAGGEGLCRAAKPPAGARGVLARGDHGRRCTIFGGLQPTAGISGPQLAPARSRVHPSAAASSSSSSSSVYNNMRGGGGGGYMLPYYYYQLKEMRMRRNLEEANREILRRALSPPRRRPISWRWRFFQATPSRLSTMSAAS